MTLVLPADGSPDKTKEQLRKRQKKKKMFLSLPPDIYPSSPLILNLQFLTLPPLSFLPFPIRERSVTSFRILGKSPGEKKWRPSRISTSIDYSGRIIKSS